MKKAWKRIVTLALALVMTVSVLPVQASAASISVPSTCTITKYSSKDYGISGTMKLNKNYFATVPKGITNLKSSNKKVVTVSKTKSGSNYMIYITAKKKGTATVSFKYKGKTYKTKVTVVKYQNPISSVKIGSKTIKGSKFDSRANCSLKYSKFKNKKVKVTITLKSGWTLGYDWCANSFEYMRKGWAKSEMKANKKSVTIKGGKGFAINIPVTNTKTGQTENVVVFFK